MKIHASNLARHLKEDLLSQIYVISTDEVLLSQEAIDSIRNSSLQRSFEEGRKFTYDIHFDWHFFFQETHNLSLMHPKRFFELRIPSLLIEDRELDRLVQYCSTFPEFNILLVKLPKLGISDFKKRWIEALVKNSNCRFMQIYPLQRYQLLKWIKRKLAVINLRASDETMEMIAERVGSNLSIATWEIQKLKFITKDQEITNTIVEKAIDNPPQVNVFLLVDLVLKANIKGSLSLLDRLKIESTDPSIILGILVREVRIFSEASLEYYQTSSTKKTLNLIKENNRRKYIEPFQSLIHKNTIEFWGSLLIEAQVIDIHIKDQKNLLVWHGLRKLIVAFCESLLGLFR